MNCLGSGKNQWKQSSLLTARTIKGYKTIANTWKNYFPGLGLNPKYYNIYCAIDYTTRYDYTSNFCVGAMRGRGAAKNQFPGPDGILGKHVLLYVRPRKFRVSAQSCVKQFYHTFVFQNKLIRRKTDAEVVLLGRFDRLYFTK